MCLRLLFKILIIFIYNINQSVALEWGWRASLDLLICQEDKICATLENHDLHHQMYLTELYTTPYMKLSNQLSMPNSCLAFITVLVQTSQNTVTAIQVPVVFKDQQIIFTSQQSVRLIESNILSADFVFSPSIIHPTQQDLTAFLKSFNPEVSCKPKQNNDDLSNINNDGKLLEKNQSSRIKRRTSNETVLNKEMFKRSNTPTPTAKDSEYHETLALENVAVYCDPSESQTDFKNEFIFNAQHHQHTEQKLVYFLLRNDGDQLIQHIHKALSLLLKTDNNADIKLKYKNVVGIILHIHTRLDVCNFCNSSLVAFKNKTINILNKKRRTSTLKDDNNSVSTTRHVTDQKSSVFLKEPYDTPVLSPEPNIQEFEELHISESEENIFPNLSNVLVTVSSRARNHSTRETMGYDEDWKINIDQNPKGEMNIKLISPFEYSDTNEHSQPIFNKSQPSRASDFPISPPLLTQQYSKEPESIEELSNFSLDESDHQFLKPPKQSENNNKIAPIAQELETVKVKNTKIYQAQNNTEKRPTQIEKIPHRIQVLLLDNQVSHKQKPQSTVSKNCFSIFPDILQTFVPDETQINVVDTTQFFSKSTRSMSYPVSSSKKSASDLNPKNSDIPYNQKAKRLPKSPAPFNMMSSENPNHPPSETSKISTRPRRSPLGNINQNTQK